jgi:hypothetical protein
MAIPNVRILKDHIEYQANDNAVKLQFVVDGVSYTCTPLLLRNITTNRWDVWFEWNSKIWYASTRRAGSKDGSAELLPFIAKQVEKPHQSKPLLPYLPSQYKPVSLGGTKQRKKTSFNRSGIGSSCLSVLQKDM